MAGVPKRALEQAPEVKEAVVDADEEILQRIHGLVEEEHALREAEGSLDSDRLDRLEKMLDQCWDLLRRRRARREYGQDPSLIEGRDIDTIEGYQQ